MLSFLLTIIFFLFRVMPGDPTALLLSGRFSEEARQAMLENFGLTRPLHEQYVIFIVNVLQGDYGISFFYRVPVADVIFPRLINTLLLMIPALSLVMVFAYLWGSIVGWSKDTQLDRWGTYIPVSIRAIPHFVLGLFLLMVFSYSLGWLPTGGMGPIGGETLSLGETLTSRTFYLYAALPFFTALLHYAADPMLLMRNNIISERNKDYTELHRLKGLRPRQIRQRAARNSMLPLLTWLTPLVGIAFGGQILIEVVFSWPGIGRELVLAAQRQDMPVAQAAFFMVAFMVLLTNLIVDLAYGYFDPRIDYGKS
jgi:peptide/nickel transport system permease protein